MCTRIAPAFFLKGLDIKKLVLDYQSGLFNRPIRQKAKIVPTAANILQPAYGEDGCSPMYRMKSKNDMPIIVVTNNNKSFEFFVKSKGALPTGGVCDYCRRPFEGQVVGYPVEYQEKAILSTEGERSVYRNIYMFWIDGEFCSFSCALTFLQNLMIRPAAYRDNSALDSIRQLHFLHSLMHPEATLTHRSDAKLLTCNGGSVSEEEWLAGSSLAFVKSERVVIMPAKNEYIRTTITPAPK